MTAVNEAAVAIRTAPACRVGSAASLVVSGAAPRRGRAPRPAPPRALDPVERQGVLDLLHTRFVDQAPAQVHAALLDEGTYLCSTRTRKESTAMGEQGTKERTESRAEWTTLETFAREQMQRWLQQLMEEEVTELLGRDKSVRRAPVDAPSSTSCRRKRRGRRSSCSRRSRTLRRAQKLNG